MEGRLNKVNMPKMARARHIIALARFAPVACTRRYAQMSIHEPCLLRHAALVEFFMAFDLGDGKVFDVIRRQQTKLHTFDFDELARLAVPDAVSVSLCEASCYYLRWLLRERLRIHSMQKETPKC